MRRTMCVVLMLASCLALFANGVQETSVSAPETEKKTVAVVLPSPLGDRSFCDSANEGVKRANATLPVTVDLIETQGVHEHETAMRSAINKGYGLILGVGLDTQMMLDLANEYPDQLFGSPSELFADNLPDNLASLLINVNKSSFLAGVAAGMLTKTNKVGAVCGGDSPGINQFFYGYKQGVLAVNPEAEVYVNYLGFDFSNPTLGKESAMALYDQGCDILFQVCGLSGEGVLAAAAERNLYAIGVDNVQDEFYPGHIITSVIKRVDNSTFELIDEYVKGTFKGGFRKLDMEDGCTGLSWDTGVDTFEKNGPADMVAKMPEVKATVEDYRARILSGEYKVYDALTDPLWESLK